MPSANAPKSTSTRSRPKTAATIVGWACDESLLFQDPESPFRAVMQKKAGKLIVVTGENASGKSLLVRIASHVFNQEEILPVAVSIRERTESGIRKAIMFGAETEQSTGATSVNVIQTAFKNLDRPSVLIVDEPELGLSEGYARALGEYIGQATKEIPSKCLGVIVVSHSRPLVEGLGVGYGKPPTHVAVGVGEPKAGLLKWLAEEEHRTVEDLLRLREVGHERWLRVSKLIKS